MMALLIDLAERGWVPDVLVRAGIRQIIRGRLKEEYGDGESARIARVNQLMRELGESVVALETDRANQQHYGRRIADRRAAGIADRRGQRS